MADSTQRNDEIEWRIRKVLDVMHDDLTEHERDVVAVCLNATEYALAIETLGGIALTRTIRKSTLINFEIICELQRLCAITSLEVPDKMDRN